MAVRMLDPTAAATLQHHTLAALLPPMNDAEYNVLRNDIHQHGQRSAITLHEGRVLDGRHRLRVLVELGREVAAQDLPANIPARDFVLSMNLHRRNLSQSQQALIGARMVTTRRGVAATDADVSQEDAALLLGVSSRYVRDGQWLLEHDEGAAQDVFEGRITLAQAVRAARAPLRTQRVEPPPQIEPHPPTPAIVPVAPASIATGEPAALLLAIGEWLLAEPRDHAPILAAFGPRAAQLVPALDDFARRLWDLADDEGLLPQR